MKTQIILPALALCLAGCELISLPTHPGSQTNRAVPPQTDVARSTRAVSLAPGASTRIVLRVTEGQMLNIASSSPDIVVTFVRGNLHGLSKGSDGTYVGSGGQNVSNNTEVVLDVRNRTNKAVNATLRIIIESAGC